MKASKLLASLSKSSAARLVRESPVWFVTPALVLGAGVAVAAGSYEPLVFDASQYETQTAQAAELDQTVDAAKLEKKSSSSSKKKKAAAAAKAAQSSAQSSAAKAQKLAKAKLADGSYTGFSRCTEEDVFDYYLRLSIKVKDGKVVDIYDVRGSATGDSGSKNLGEYDSINDSYISKASAGVLSQLKSAASAGKTPSDIDTVSGATYSSSSMLEAYLDALGKSAAAAGTKVDKGNSKKDNNKNNSKKDDSGKTDPDPEPAPTPDPDPAPVEELDYGTGTWTSYALCKNKRQPAAYAPYYIGVTVETLDGKVTAIKDIFGDDQGLADPDVIYDEAENKYYLDRALNGYGVSGKNPGVKTQLETIIASGKADGSVDTVSGATYSSRAILEAYRAAIALAYESTVTTSGSAQDTTSQDDAADKSDAAGSGSTSVSAGANGAAASAVTTLSTRLWVRGTNI